jgi:signal transduction histidine kinase
MRVLDSRNALTEWWHNVESSLRTGRKRLQERAAPVPALPSAEVAAPTRGVLQLMSGVSLWSGIFATIVGYHGVLGWLFDIQLLKTINIDLPLMSAAEAISAVLAGAGLLSAHASRRASRLSPAVPVLGALTVLVGVVSVFAPLLDGRLDLSPAMPGATAVAMPAASALAFVFVGLGLVLAGWRQRFGAAELLGAGATGLSLLALAAYSYGAPPFLGQMPLYTAVSTLFLGIGLAFVRPDTGFMAKISSNSLGGSMARRLLPATLLIPLVLGLIQVNLEQEGMFPFESGLAFHGMATVVLFVGVVWWTVNSLYRMDTQRLHAERELRDTAAKLKRSNADLEQFAYVASHDLKEPLRAISGSVQVLQDRYGPLLPDDAEEFVRHTVDGANRMQTLIDDLLTYSRLTTREAPLEPTDTGEILQESIANLTTAIREARAVITFDPLPVVKGDRTQLVQVFQNLLSNALKYRSERTPKVHVSCEQRPDEWLFSVRDNGIGISPQYQDKIFKIFQRLHTRQEYAGTGIGLAVCKKVVERHGGRIWVESEPEEGSTFFFTIPR